MSRRRLLHERVNRNPRARFGWYTIFVTHQKPIKVILRRNEIQILIGCTENFREIRWWSENIISLSSSYCVCWHGALIFSWELQRVIFGGVLSFVVCMDGYIFSGDIGVVESVLVVSVGMHGALIFSSSSSSIIIIKKKFRYSSKKMTRWTSSLFPKRIDTPCQQTQRAQTQQHRYHHWKHIHTYIRQNCFKVWRVSILHRTRTNTITELGYRRSRISEIHRKVRDQTSNLYRKCLIYM